MSRPVKSKVEYFPHDCHHGKTIPILRGKYNNNGYAFWFILLERLGRTEGHFIDLSTNLEAEFFASETGVSVSEMYDMLDLLSELEAIDKNLWKKDGVVWCQNFIERLETVYSKRSFRPVKPSLRNGNHSFRAETPVSVSESPHSKVKERKGKERKEQSCPKSNFENDETFQKFYSIFPRKEKKHDAIKAWAKMKEPERTLAITAVQNHVAYWNDNGTEKRFIPLPASWLNAKRWEDQLVAEQDKKIYI